MRNGQKPSIPAPEGFYGCPKCGTVKPLSEFFRQKRGPSGHSSYCKACKVAIIKASVGKPDPGGAERFWAKVNKTETCWLWTASLDGRGYGQFVYEGRIKKAYQVALILAGIEPPKRKDGKCIDHTCRNSLCVNPAHLRIVTDRVNALENNSSPLARNAAVTRCPKQHPYSRENTAIMPVTGPKGTPLFQRLCLTCFPSRWRYAIVKREKPGSRRKWVGPPQGWLDKHRTE